MRGRQVTRMAFAFCLGLAGVVFQCTASAFPSTGVYWYNKYSQNPYIDRIAGCLGSGNGITQQFIVVQNNGINGDNHGLWYGKDTGSGLQYYYLTGSTYYKQLVCSGDGYLYGMENNGNIWLIGRANENSVTLVTPSLAGVDACLLGLGGSLGTLPMLIGYNDSCGYPNTIWQATMNNTSITGWTYLSTATQTATAVTGYSGVGQNIEGFSALVSSTGDNHLRIVRTNGSVISPYQSGTYGIPSSIRAIGGAGNKWIWAVDSDNSVYFGNYYPI